MAREKYLRQYGFYDPDKNGTSAVVVGAGSLGSNVVYALSKMGVQNISVFDGDVVDTHNTPNQFYTDNDVGKPKVDCLANNIKKFCGNNINTFNQFITKDTKLPVGMGMIYFLVTDSAESRKLVYSMIKDFPMKIIDVRAGGEGYHVQFVDLTNKEQVKDYTESFNTAFSQLPCGEQSVIYNVMAAAADAVSIFKREVARQPHPIVIRREMSVARILGR